MPTSIFWLTPAKLVDIVGVAFPVRVKLQFQVQNHLPFGFKLQKLPKLICVFRSNRMEDD